MQNKKEHFRLEKERFSSRFSAELLILRAVWVAVDSEKALHRFEKQHGGNCVK